MGRDNFFVTEHVTHFVGSPHRYSVWAAYSFAQIIIFFFAVVILKKQKGKSTETKQI